MLEGMATNFYKLHYEQAIAPNLTNDQKLAIANRISAMTLKAPFWQDRDTNHIEDFPELQPYVRAKLTGLYLCTIFAAIMEGYPKEAEFPT